MTLPRLLLTASATLVLTVAPALADRDPTPEETTRIEAELQRLGFTDWDDDIEMEDDNAHWEVEDAKDASGQEFDLKLHPETLAVIERDAD